MNIDLIQYIGIILGVSHNQFTSLNIKTNDEVGIYDVKGVLDRNSTDYRLW